MWIYCFEEAHSVVHVANTPVFLASNITLFLEIASCNLNDKYALPLRPLSGSMLLLVLPYILSAISYGCISTFNLSYRAEGHWLMEGCCFGTLADLSGSAKAKIMCLGSGLEAR